MNALTSDDGRRRRLAGCAKPPRRGAGCDALLVTNLTNIRYLTGFTGSAALLLVLPDDVVLVTDGRYRDQSAEQLAAAGVDARIEVGTLTGQQAGAHRRRQGHRPPRPRGGPRVTWAAAARFAGRLVPAAELVATEGLVEDLRRVKDAGEVARMAEAARIADDALADGPALLADGVTERELALALDYEMRRLGADGHLVRDDRGRRGPTAPSPTPGRRIGASSRASWSCSTSAPSSTATART